MSNTVADQGLIGHVFNHASAAAAWALSGLQHLSGEWAAIRDNPVYGPVVQTAVAMANRELVAAGVPVGELVNVGAAVEKALASMAAAHPGLVTPQENTP